MKLIYPAIFHKENDSFWVEFPDLEGCHTFGEALNETLENAQEAMELHCVSLLEAGEKLKAPTDIFELTCDENSFVSLVECDITNHLTKSRAVKKTLTIPSWLNDMATKENINFSGVLQNALMEQLHINRH